MKARLTRLLTLPRILGILAACAVPAWVNAVPMLAVTVNGGTTFTVVDNDACDRSPVLGHIDFASFACPAAPASNVNADAGTTKPAIGSANDPQMILTVIAEIFNSGTLQIDFFEDLFVASPALFVFGVGQNLDPNLVASYSTLINGELAHSVVIPRPPNANEDPFLYTGGTPYEIRQSILFSATGRALVLPSVYMVTGVTATQVPLPGTLSLLGACLIGLVGQRIARRRRKS